MSYDPKCEQLAMLFLANEVLDTPENRRELAQEIQDQIESWFTGKELEADRKRAAAEAERGREFSDQLDRCMERIRDSDDGWGTFV